MKERLRFEREMQDLIIEAESRSQTTGDSKPSPVRARILWPAFGFPAVIAPKDSPSASQMLDCDACRCICVLVLSNRKYLSKEEAARYLRYVPWAERDRRHIPAGQTGSFAEVDLAVRNDVKEPKLTLPGWRDSLAVGIAFGGNRDGENGITVSLAHYVRNFYRKQGLEYLHEIRISEEASKQLRDGIYNLFWNNEVPNEKAPSDEMKLLLDLFAFPRRKALTELWEKHHTFLLAEYEFEYGTLQRPYRSELAMRRIRTEILHPLHIQRTPPKGIKIGHITDIHIDVRANVYEENLRKWKVGASYNNWNTSFEKIYNDAKRDSDVLFLTGDLIDYGRGHWGLTAANQLGEDRLYHVDRNWFLFYYLLASGDAYKKPVYTVLGNHDWRLNPYPPFAFAGVPSPKSLIHDHTKFNEEDLKEILRKAHGHGYDRKFSYYLETDEAFLKSFWESGKLLKTLTRMLANKRTLDEPHLPVETTVESVVWYLLSINPFLDYSFSLPSGHKILMLDWAEDEDLLFPIVQGGKEWPYMLWQAKNAAAPGPKARNCLTNLQQRLVKDFIAAAGKAKVVGMHAPPIGPYPDWYDYPDLFTGRKIYGHKEKPRGPTNSFATRKLDGSIEKWHGHPIFAVRPFPPRPSPPDAYSGTFADYGSFEKNRLWFIKKISEPNSGVRIVLSGHLHRNGLFVIRVPGEKEGSAIAGKMIVRGLLPETKVSEKVAMGLSKLSFPFPLYINTTSAGPRGTFKSRQLTEEEKKKGGLTIDPGYSLVELVADGTIKSVEFRFP